MPRTVQANTRIEPELSDLLDKLADSTQRTRSTLIYNAVRSYVESETEFLAAIEQGRADIEAGRGVRWEETKARMRRILDTAGRRS